MLKKIVIQTKYLTLPCARNSLDTIKVGVMYSILSNISTSISISIYFCCVIAFFFWGGGKESHDLLRCAKAIVYVSISLLQTVVKFLRYPGGSCNAAQKLPPSNEREQEFRLLSVGGKIDETSTDITINLLPDNGRVVLMSSDARCKQNAAHMH